MGRTEPSITNARSCTDTPLTENCLKLQSNLGGKKKKKKKKKKRRKKNDKTKTNKKEEREEKCNVNWGLRVGSRGETFKQNVKST